MLDGDTDMKHRLKASELLGKASGDFTIRTDLDMTVDSNCIYDLSKLSEAELFTLRAFLCKAK